MEDGGSDEPADASSTSICRHVFKDDSKESVFSISNIEVSDICLTFFSSKVSADGETLTISLCNCDDTAEYGRRLRRIYVTL